MKKMLGCVGVVALLSANAAIASELRFSSTAPGGVVATGNTLGLSKDTNNNGPGVRDSIGTFVTLGGTVDDAPVSTTTSYPVGTTADWTQNGSSALLQLPESQTELGFVDVLYAELIWGGSYALGGEDVTANLNDAVTLHAEGATLSVSPDPTTALTLDAIALTGFPIKYYMRSAEVTDFVRTHRGVDYAVTGVPATQTDLINSLNAAGWTLVVAYRNDGEPLRNLSVFIGGSFVDEDTQEDYAVSGFCAPPSGTIFGRAALSTIEGDANLVGDQLLIAPDVGSAFVNLAGPNNPSDNFFCSQMNGPDGERDGSGTFGDANHDAINGVNIVGGRQGWDVTTVGLSSLEGHLVAGQQSAVLRTITTGDSYVPTLAAFQIDVNAPNLTTSTIFPSDTTVDVGDPLIITSTATNTGLADASSLVFELDLPQGLALTRITSDDVEGDVNGGAVNEAALGTGIDEGTLAPGQTRRVVVELTVTGPPAGVYFVAPVWSFDYVTCVGQAPVSETFSHGVTVTFVGDTGEGEGEGEEGEGEGEGQEGEGEGNEGEGEEGEGEGENPDDGGGIPLDQSVEDGVADDCGCRSQDHASTMVFALALMALRVRVRRRTRLPAFSSQPGNDRCERV